MKLIKCFPSKIKEKIINADHFFSILIVSNQCNKGKKNK